LITEALTSLNVTLSVLAPIVIVSLPLLKTVTPAVPETNLSVLSLDNSKPSSEPDI